MSMYGWEMLTFNAKDGYLEGIVRGHTLDVLKMHDYAQLAQCDNLADLKMHLAPLALGKSLANDASPTLTVDTFVEAATVQLVADFEYIRCQASEPLATFLDYLTYGYMLDNVVLIVSGAQHERDLHELLDSCHPLGMFENIGALTVARTMSELYHLVLVDTPLAEYFADCLTHDDLSEMNVEIMRCKLYRAYLDDFNNFVEGLGGTTCSFMSMMLAFEADRRAINLTINSIGTEVTRDDRLDLFSSCGTLYPQGQLALSACEDLSQVQGVLERYTHFANITSHMEYTDGIPFLDKHFYEEERKLAQGAFELQFHYGVFYALMKIREQEIRNLMWIGECIVQNQKDKLWDNVVCLS